MEIERIPSKLLFSHDCVIIPGLGGFVANPKGASVHPGRHTFNPPYKAILFNRSLNSNDGLFVNEVAKELKISYSESLQAINNFVSEVNTKLRNKQKIYFTDLGILQTDLEGNIYFTQDNEVNFLLDAFGLDEFQSLPVVKTNKPIQRTSVKIDRGPQPITRSRKHTSNRQVVYAGTALALVLGALSFFVNLGLSGNFDVASFTFTDNKAHVAATSWPANDIPEITLRPTLIVDSLVEDSIATVVEHTKEVAIKPAPVITTNTNKQYYVIAGCFEELGNARKYIEILKHDGFSASIADKKSTKLFKVYLASFDKMSEATKYIDTLADSLASTVWIYTDK